MGLLPIQARGGGGDILPVDRSFFLSFLNTIIDPKRRKASVLCQEVESGRLTVRLTAQRGQGVLGPTVDEPIAREWLRELGGQSCREGVFA